MAEKEREHLASFNELLPRRRVRPSLQPGNRLELAWKARLADHLGNVSVQPMQLFGARLA